MLCGTHFEYTILTMQLWKVPKEMLLQLYPINDRFWHIDEPKVNSHIHQLPMDSVLRKQVSIHVWFLFYVTFISIHVPITNIFTTQGSYHIHTYMYVSILFVHVIRHTQYNSYTIHMFLILWGVMNGSRTISFINKC